MEKRPGDEFVLLLVLIVGNRIILRPSSVVGVGVSKLALFSDLFFAYPLSPPFYAFSPLGILVLGCNQCLRTILNGDEGLDLTHSWEYVTTCLLRNLLFFFLHISLHFYSSTTRNLLKWWFRPRPHVLASLGQSSFEVHLKSSRIEIFFGKKIQ